LSEQDLSLVARELRHDVRNQLFALRTTMAVLEQSLAAPERLARSVHACALTLEHLTAEIQEYFALQSGDFTTSEIALDRLLKECFQPVALLANSHRLELSFDALYVKLSGRPVILTLALKHLARALIRMANKRITLGLRSVGEHATITARYTERRGLDEQAREEIEGDLKALRQCLGICRGSLETGPGALVISLPLALT